MNSIGIRVECQVVEVEYLLTRPFKFEYAAMGALYSTKVIESCLLRLPMQCIVVDVRNSTWEVLVGIRRFAALTAFIRNEFYLKGLVYFKELEELKYKGLERRHQRCIEETTVPIIRIEAGTSNENTKDIIERYKAQD